MGKAWGRDNYFRGGHLPGPMTGEGSGQNKTDLGPWDILYRTKREVWRGQPAKLPRLPEGSRVLELGCGNGKTLRGMLKMPWRITAVDISPTAVEICRVMAKGMKGQGGLDLLTADARALPFRPGSFDAVFAFHVIGHVYFADRQEMVKEVSRVLVPGGRMFFRDFSVADFRFGSGKEVETGTFMRGDGVITHYFTREELSGLFRELTTVSISPAVWYQRVGAERKKRSEFEAVLEKGGP
jgi:ubiquinone/menaquinone biosynthesis C-methylase UbiE